MCNLNVTFLYSLPFVFYMSYLHVAYVHGLICMYFEIFEAKGYFQC